ncbi:REPEAT-CONTAINING PROTEIN putative-RELATED [Salix purpurea]|uniref:REPEAT-CONTAINING PROTEIN putative-RELATED n=1 Tax=Salix purpurea TaxID=77065 RepID=A0A9Q0VX14_SALPP|nr:REPEAT-CONTAINING PROTEIN putative-RELATED [Salix purpurea]
MGLSSPVHHRSDSACERIKALKKCEEVHGSIIRSGYERDVVVCTGLVRCYGGNGQGYHQEALRIYDNMTNENVGVDGFTLVGLLSSCSHVGALNMGVKLHRIASEIGLLRNVFVGNALIDMYAKCGNLDGALEVFNGMPRDMFSWNSMIVGFGVHGFGDEAIYFFNQMLEAGVRPNSIAFLGLLCGCSHQGLVEEGVEFFHQMSSKFNVKPGIKHFGCIVDMYGRAGKLEKALEIIGDSPWQDDPVLWRILLSSSKIHKNVVIGEIAMRNLSQLGAVNAGDCVLLATIYAGDNDEQGVARMRKLIKNQGIKTTPGWSWIEVSDQVHRFVVDDKSHPDSGMIYQKLEEVTHKATMAGYVKGKSQFIFHGSCSEECLESSSTYHSEKLAIAFGLAKTPEGTSLRIVKNLRVCRDCHEFTKFVSQAFNRDIIVRDRLRFHHFKGGLCSCRDYW